MPKAKTTTPLQVCLFYPNLIGYTRVILSLISFCLLGHFPIAFLFCYIIGFVLDAVDGMVARRFGQCTQFGAILDMLTDRASTAGLIVVVVQVLQPLPHWGATSLACLVFLDISSHFCVMYVSLYAGRTSHKDVSSSIFSLLRLYYTNRPFMCALCVGQELFYLNLYMYGVYGIAEPAFLFFMALTAALSAFKQVVNVQQLLDSMYHLAVLDAAGSRQ
ncbi:CDP-diacylglycerol--inositol 3-phosphatidyltransferase, putative [Trypanosoma equiperdum]|uniref:CDP-diacylglycerol--inositol 3-phosphatidyltransferase n=5 Tax=Trypanozoon TaxID=39700 RepID=Q38FY6_TRYB2|nr:phosphatidyltransferase, putative [Trypanosoma brucei gambiense DAL972]XP_803450.1 phosphatidyltransferase, putative [Trypanosoma brucei brucei TREU927]RHW67294.1 CDP-diacylglycerol--inositol 3-phosphatidyltransferase [Trypanosoma brucei equiperdum]CAG29793.1 phosphatidylinositol synthase [Trypanosoma brucei brucei]SCU67487.1 CDP-diacylglycerol--inositol 3-phosphatidyltransferase, putative [Trypanosoma equiperdum]EAN76284.1 phosphatidyltransferase, putative [Trypanosoma brucei brucei TREU92|eukprot:XP_011776234.1 phosphatidyltransferase, putative [Trypanosoma brucei gambiense DAL972]